MQSQKIFIVEHDGKTIGVWDSLESAKTFIMGCQQNGLMVSSANIKTYQINTCFCLETNTINPPGLSEQTSFLKPNKQTNIAVNNEKIPQSESKPTLPIEKPKIDIKDPAYIEMTKQRIELQHKINMLKQQKKKIEESKTTYANDCKLFELFTESKHKDPEFVVPEIFIKKFDLMTQLKNENKLSWENFVKEFQHENFYNEYFGLNSYEEMFLDSGDGDISEELDIESDSNTDTSDKEN